MAKPSAASRIPRVQASKSRKTARLSLIHIYSHYRGELKVALINLDPNNVFQVKPGDRIAQLVIQKVEQVVWNVVSSLDETERGKGGFGSSGVA